MLIELDKTTACGGGSGGAARSLLPTRAWTLSALSGARRGSTPHSRSTPSVLAAQPNPRSPVRCTVRGHALGSPSVSADKEPRRGEVLPRGFAHAGDDDPDVVLVVEFVRVGVHHEARRLGPADRRRCAARARYPRFDPDLASHSRVSEPTAPLFPGMALVAQKPTGVRALDSAAVPTVPPLIKSQQVLSEQEPGIEPGTHRAKASRQACAPWRACRWRKLRRGWRWPGRSRYGTPRSTRRFIGLQSCGRTALRRGRRTAQRLM